MCAINLILFSELARLVYDAAFALVSVLLVCCIDALAERFYKKRYRQPRLLIIDTDPTNISRTKRIKYGVLKSTTLGTKILRAKPRRSLSNL